MSINDRSFKGIWIPKEIWLDQNLSWSEKLLLVEIESLDNELGCYAGNDYFATFFNLSKDRVSKLVSSLKNKGYLTVNFIYKGQTKEIDKRVIKSVFRYSKKHLEGIGENNEGYSQERLEGIGENNEGYSQERLEGIGENAKDNNTSINNTSNNINTSKTCISPPVRKNQNIDWVGFQNFWNEKIKLVGIKKLSEPRKKAIKSLVAEYGKSEFMEILLTVNSSDFLNNGSGDRNWKADIDFILKPKNFLKLTEGGYHTEKERTSEIDSYFGFSADEWAKLDSEQKTRAEIIWNKKNKK